MPINAFGGGPGTGKTYGVMEHVILPAVAKGRFVLTNIDGLNTDAIYQYVVDTYYRGKIICVGHIRCCGRSRPGEDGFFPGVDSLDKPCTVPDLVADTVVGGDLVVVDEATRYWAMGDKVSKEAAFFFREHRHFANEMGQTCDMVVIDPDLSLLARPLKGKIELSSITHKTKAIGLNRYVVRLFRGVKTTGKPQSTSPPSPFKKEIYALYKSYSHEGAKESAVDARQNIFSGTRFWYTLVFFVVLVSVALYFVWGFFHPAGSAPAKGKAPVASVAVGAAGALQPTVQQPVVSGEWRVVGSYTGASGSWVVVADSAGRLRFESPSVFAGGAFVPVGSVDGANVTRYSGSPVVGRPVVQGGVK